MIYQVLTCGLKPEDRKRIECYLDPWCLESCLADELVERYEDAVCVIADPSVLSEEQWYFLCERRRRPGMPMLLLTGEPREEAQQCIPEFCDVLQLCDGKRKVLRDQLYLVNQTRWLPWNCSSAAMDSVFRSTVWNDGWYLLDLTTSGEDPSVDEILVIRMAYMANYQIQWEWSAPITPEKPVSAEILKKKGLTEAYISDGVPLEEIVRGLNDLAYPDAPLLIFNENNTSDFITHAYRRYGKRSIHEFLEVDTLAIRLFGYTFQNKAEDILGAIGWNRVGQRALRDERLALLYDLSLAAFREMQEQYDVRAPGDFDKLYGEGAAE